MDTNYDGSTSRMDRQSGGILANRPVSNRKRDLDELLASAPEGALVVVDQKRKIGSLALRRARKAGRRRPPARTRRTRGL